MCARGSELFLYVLAAVCVAGTYAATQGTLLQYLKDHQNIQPTEKRKVQGN